MIKAKETPARRFSLFKAWACSFFSMDLYRDVAENWKGTGYAALCLTILLLTVPRAVSVQWKTSQWAPEFIKKVPPFKIEEGVFSSDVVQPYRIDYPEGAIVVDTTGRYKSLIEVPGYANLKNILLINKTKWMEHRVRLGNAEDKTRNMFHVHSFVADRERLDHWAANFVAFSGTCYYLLLAVMWLLSNLVLLLLYGMIGIVFADLRKGSLDFNVALRLAVVSHFPAMILSTLAACFWFQPPWPYLWTFLISTGYLFFAVLSLKKLEPV